MTTQLGQIHFIPKPLLSVPEFCFGFADKGNHPDAVCNLTLYRRAGKSPSEAATVAVVTDAGPHWPVSAYAPQIATAIANEYQILPGALIYIQVDKSEDTRHLIEFSIWESEGQPFGHYCEEGESYLPDEVWQSILDLVAR